MGNPTAGGGHGRNASSSSSSSAAATAAVISLLKPLLARSGLGDSRIMRIVAVCPRSGGGEEGGGSRSSSECGRSAFSNRTTATPGFARLPHSEQRRGGQRGALGGVRGGGVVEALREGVQDEGAVAPASTAVVLETGAENSSLGVSDVLRKAVLCGNGGLASALSCSDGAVHGHRRHCNGNISTSNGAVRGSVVGPRRSSTVLPVVRPQGKPGSNELSVGARSSVQQKGPRNSNAGGSSGSDTAEGGFGSSTGCVVVGAAPGLLLSSSHLLWALRPPLGEAIGLAYNSAFDVAGESADYVRDRDSSGDDEGGDLAGGDPTEASSRRDGGFQSGGVGAQKPSNADSSRRERLGRDVAWIGAAPVGSRVYYCLEEAEWEASRRRDGYSSSLLHAASMLELQDSAPQHGSSSSSSSRRRRRPRSAEDAPRSARGHDRARESSPSSGEDGGDANSEGERAPQRSSERALRQEDGQEMGTAHDRNKAAATTFARSVSRMLAKVYLDPRPHPGKYPEPEGRKDGEDGLGDNGLGTPARAAWASRTGEASAGSGFAYEDVAAGSFVVSGVTDTHRRIARSKAGFDGDERLEALAAVPDILVAGERPEVRGKRRGRSTKGTPNNPPSLHFAPAGVLQLVGTPHFREFVEALPPEARARLSNLYPESSVRAAPIGQLYVALAPSLPRGTGLLSSAAVASATPPEDASRSVVGQCNGLPSYPPGPEGTDRPVGVGPMPGALVHPLPARAVRELLQIYVATTRAVGVVRTAVGEAGLGKAKRHRTSGLFVPPPLLTTRDRHSSSVDSRTTKSGGGGDDDDTKAEDQDCAEFRRRGKTGGLGERGRSAERGGGQPEGLVGGCDGGGSGGSGGRGRRETYWARLAARPPSAVDVLPDTPIQAGDAGSGGLLSAGIEPRKREPHGSQSDVCDKNNRDVVTKVDSALVQGFGLGDQPRSAPNTVGHDGEAPAAPAVFTRRDNSMTEVPIASSLRTPFRHKYAAVLAPPPRPPVPSIGTNGNSDGCGRGAGHRAGAEGKPNNPFSGASALILQLQIPTATGRDSPRLDIAESYGSSCGSGAVSDEAVASRTGAAGEGQCGIPPRVCGWRACLADASSG